ncbi:MAG: methyltransferase domain-containing protein [Clostridiales bacterium]|nr:methyltransferase domain-containing protein [Clostridiales bacterium]
MKKLIKDEIRAVLSEPNGADKLANMNVGQDALLKTASEMFIEEGAASALLARLASSKRMLIKMSEDEALKAALLNNLGSESPKLRRNCARLLGALRDPAFAEALTSALSREETRFVRPSLLLALGAVGGEKAAEVLSRYEVVPPKDVTENKHFEEEKAALVMARRSLAPKTEHVFSGLKAKETVELRAPYKLTHQLAGELSDMGVASFDIRQDSLKVTTDDYPGLFFARCFTEALFPIGTSSVDPAAIAGKAVPFMERLLLSCHEGEPPIRFRVELSASLPEEVSRQELVKRIAEACESVALQNSPGDYEAELRIEGNMRSARLYIKLFTFKDTRFSYRKESIPASMNPAVAAAVLRFAQDRLSVGARVIDPCCGSGTFLIERGKLSPCASLTGVDISHKAIDIARRNTELSGVPAKYTVNDILRFECHRPYDELIANLPFGNRVGDHSSCEKLYKGLLAKLPQLVKKGGIAILYTMEFTLLKRLIRETPRVTLLSQERTEAGGLTPMIFILQVD